MTGASHGIATGLSRRGQAFWLPYGGWGNGLPAKAWVPIAEVVGDHAATLVLAALRDADVPAYAARLHPSRTRGHRAASRPHVGIWVGASSYGTAEALLLALIPAIGEALQQPILP